MGERCSAGPPLRERGSKVDAATGAAAEFSSPESSHAMSAVRLREIRYGSKQGFEPALEVCTPRARVRPGEIGGHRLQAGSASVGPGPQGPSRWTPPPATLRPRR